jgi:two-component system, chemotaxis family, sensor kinase CheA
MQDYKILCLDDENDILNIYQETLQEIGYDTVVFNNGAAALEYLKLNHRKTLMIFSDLKMPEMDGFAFKAALNEINADIPVVIITAFWDKKMAETAMALGVRAFLEKPFSPKIIAENIEKIADPRKIVLDEEAEMIQGFLDESSPMLDEIEVLILQLEQDGGAEQTLATYFRLLHTIKGTASCVGLDVLGQFAHKYEDFIGKLRNHLIPVNTGSINILLKGLDGLKVLFELCKNSQQDSFVLADSIHIFEGKVDDTAPMEKACVAPIKAENDRIQAEHYAKSEHKEDEKMSVSMGLLDEFMQESGELTVVRNSIVKTVKNLEVKMRGDKDVAQLSDLLRGMYQVTSQIQQKISDMRKVALSHVFRPFKRLVRDISKDLTKKVDFVVEGEDLSVDKVVANLFSNTLIHLMRNSLDHGIEKPADRIKSNKPETGLLKISVRESGEMIELIISDDGKGINPDVIKSIAVKKGLYTESELAFMSKSEIQAIIFDSGFSTAEKVSDLSGRGVGMDMVRSSVFEQGGTIEIKSDVGVGSQFKILVPIPKSVLIINTLHTQCSGQNFMFRMDDVLEVVTIDDYQTKPEILKIDDAYFLDHNNDLLQLVFLADVLGLPRKHSSQMNIVLIKNKKFTLGLIVDKILEFEEVVSKKISQSIKSSKFYEGASLLGSGEVALVLSIDGICSSLKFENAQAKAKKRTDKVFVDERPLSEYMAFYTSPSERLIVDLSSVERLEMLSVKLLQKVGDRFVIRHRGETLQVVDPAYALDLNDDCKVHDKFMHEQQEYMNLVVLKMAGHRLALLVHRMDEIRSTRESVDCMVADHEGIIGTVYIDGSTLSVLDVKFIFQKFVKGFYLDMEQDAIDMIDHDIDLPQAA